MSWSFDLLSGRFPQLSLASILLSFWNSALILNFSELSPIIWIFKNGIWFLPREGSIFFYLIALMSQGEGFPLSLQFWFSVCALPLFCLVVLAFVIQASLKGLRSLASMLILERGTKELTGRLRAWGWGGAGWPDSSISVGDLAGLCRCPAPPTPYTCIRVSLGFLSTLGTFSREYLPMCPLGGCQPSCLCGLGR